MSKYIEIAKQFVKKQIVERDNIVGAILVGSVARGDQSAFSDIDLRIIVESKEGNWLTRNDSHAWIEGIYIDAGIVTRDAYTDVNQVLAHPTTANDMNHAVILYDPEDFLAEVQAQTQALFMQPKWVGMRIKPHMDRLPPRMKALKEAIDADDAPNICIHAGRIFFSATLIPLFLQGISPSSTRNLIQLDEIDSSAKQQLCELEGIARLDGAKIEEAIALLAKLTAIADTERWGDLPEYVVQKVRWMVHNGYPQEGMHTAWSNCGLRMKDCLDRGNPQVMAEASVLIEEWFGIVGWSGQEERTEKLTLIASIWQALEESTKEVYDAQTK